MAKRELSTTLRNLKFMQRASLRDENTKKEEEVKPDGNFSSPSIAIRKCMVIMEGDPHPGALKGRMSFQSFNPSIDKLNKEEANICQRTAPTSVSGNQNGKTLFREDADGAECSSVDGINYEANGALKREPSEVVSEAQYPNKSPKTGQDGHDASPKNNSGYFKKPKSQKLDWSVLRPSESQNKRG
ncbi:M-phase phosphoprotein 6 [Quillaja saponaria]|uniref:M-phase phosphoprotein 6 n=1 Tax=Quillaja saponaria TaxID=32244 RepID=A0AAD7KXC5_QUISA|nr:M-phase phosphoprotein 6 [Quillaja saponaria]